MSDSEVSTPQAKGTLCDGSLFFCFAHELRALSPLLCMCLKSHDMNMFQWTKMVIFNYSNPTFVFPILSPGLPFVFCVVLF